LGGKDVFLIIFKKEIVVPENLFLMIENQSILLSEYNLSMLKINKSVTPNTLACYKGMSDWQPLHQIAPQLVEFLIH
jgi:hypothetical protein